MPGNFQIGGGKSCVIEYKFKNKPKKWRDGGAKNKIKVWVLGMKLDIPLPKKPVRKLVRVQWS